MEEGLGYDADDRDYSVYTGTTGEQVVSDGLELFKASTGVWATLMTVEFGTFYHKSCLKENSEACLRSSLKNTKNN